MPDYTKLLDPEIQDFIAETESWYPPDTIDASVAEQREIYNRMCRGMAAPRPANVTTKDSAIETGTHAIPIRTYKSQPAPMAKLVYFHGGGFVVGGLESHDDVCAEICDRTGFEVIAVDYRLSPEHPFPADFEDAHASYMVVRQGTDLPVIVAGDSAGGCLAAAVSQSLEAGLTPPVGQVLIYPALGHDTRLASYVEHADAPMLTTKDVAFYHSMRTAGDANLLRDPRCAPLEGESFSNLPPTFILSAQCDPLASESAAYHSALKAAGTQVQWIDEPGLVHGFLRARHRSDKARLAFDKIIDAITELGVTGSLRRTGEAARGATA